MGTLMLPDPPREQLDRMLIDLNEYIRELTRVRIDLDSIAVARRLLDIRDGV